MKVGLRTEGPDHILILVLLRQKASIRICVTRESIFVVVVIE